MVGFNFFSYVFRQFVPLRSVPLRRLSMAIRFIWQVQLHEVSTPQTDVAGPNRMKSGSGKAGVNRWKGLRSHRALSLTSSHNIMDTTPAPAGIFHRIPFCWLTFTSFLIHILVFSWTRHLCWLVFSCWWHPHLCWRLDELAG